MSTSYSKRACKIMGIRQVHKCWHFPRIIMTAKTVSHVSEVPACLGYKRLDLKWEPFPEP